MGDEGERGIERSKGYFGVCFLLKWAHLASNEGLDGWARTFSLWPSLQPSPIPNRGVVGDLLDARMERPPPSRLDHGNKSLYENSNSAAQVFLPKFIGSPVVDRWPRRPYSSTLLKIGDSIIWTLNTPNPRFIDGKSKRLLVSISWNTDIPVHDIKMKYILESWEMTRFNKAWGKVIRAVNRSG